jgi:hypothetical protein
MRCAALASAPQFRDITMRLSLLVHTTAGEGGLLSDSVSQKVDEYQELVHLLHTAADDKLLALVRAPPGAGRPVAAAQHASCHCLC